MLTNILTFFNRGQRIQPGTEATTHPTGHQSWWDGDAGIVVLSNDHHAWGRLFGVGGGGSSTRTVRRGSTFLFVWITKIAPYRVTHNQHGTNTPTNFDRAHPLPIFFL
jgi:hypothetical protein